MNYIYDMYICMNYFYDMYVQHMCVQYFNIKSHLSLVAVVTGSVANIIN